MQCEDWDNAVRRDTDLFPDTMSLSRSTTTIVDTVGAGEKSGPRGW